LAGVGFYAGWLFSKKAQPQNHCNSKADLKVTHCKQGGQKETVRDFETEGKSPRRISLCNHEQLLRRCD